MCPPYNLNIEEFRPSGMDAEGDWVARVQRLAEQDSLPEDEYQAVQCRGLPLWYKFLREGAFHNHKNRYAGKTGYFSPPLATGSVQVSTGDHLEQRTGRDGF